MPPADPVTVVWVIAAMGAATLVIANLLALGPAILAARSRAADLLSTE